MNFSISTNMNLILFSEKQARYTVLSHSYEIHEQAKLYTMFNIYVYMTYI